MHCRPIVGRAVQVMSAIGFSAGLLCLAPDAMAAEQGVDDGEHRSPIAVLDSLALEQNPLFEAIDARSNAAHSEADFEAHRLPEPVVEYMAELTVPGVGHFTTGHMIQVMQQIPRRGARERRAAPARASASVADAEKGQKAAEVLRDLRQDLVELARLNGQLALVDEEVGLIDDAIAMVEDLSSLGRAEVADLLQLELAREGAIDRQIQLEGARDSRRGQLAQRLAVAPEELPASLGDEDILTRWQVELPPEEQLLTWAGEADPRLVRFDAQMDVVAARLALVDEQNRPWPSVMVGYANGPPMWEMDGGRHQMIQLGVSMPLPIFGGQYDAQASQWQAEQVALEQEQRQLRQSVAGEVNGLVARGRQARRRVRRQQREVLPLTGDVSEQMLIAVELGERSAADFILAVGQEIEVEGRIIDGRAEFLSALIELQFLTGGAVGADAPWAYPEALRGLL